MKREGIKKPEMIGVVEKLFRNRNETCFAQRTYIINDNVIVTSSRTILKPTRL